jgi:hypothetical protein
MDRNYWDYGDIPIDGRITLHIAILYCIEMDPQKRVMLHHPFWPSARQKIMVTPFGDSAIFIFLESLAKEFLECDDTS